MAQKWVEKIRYSSWVPYDADGKALRLASTIHSQNIIVPANDLEIKIAEHDKSLDVPSV